MKNILLIVITIFVSATIFSSCTESKEKTTKGIKEQLAAIEKDLMANKKDTVALHDLEIDIENYATKFPDDTATAEFIYQLAGKQWQAGETYKALKNYEKLTFSKIVSYARKSLNDEAVIYLTSLNDVEKAKQLFQQYLDKYKGQDEAETRMVEAELNTAGKSIDEIVKGWDEKKDSLDTKNNNRK